MKKKLPYIMMGLLLVVGLLALFYPTISNWYNENYHKQVIYSYDDTIAQMTEETLSAALARGREYNESLSGLGLTDPFIPGGAPKLPHDYTAVLDAGGGVMGTIEIPKISVDLPIYHGTATEVLEKGVGHMEMTAFPIGGEGNHAVLTGHTALPKSTLFTDLDKLEKGDEFFISVFGQTTAYRVDQITVVEPSNTKSLIPTPGKDYVTLVTCTPYAINSHRLLVRGERIPFEAANANAPGEFPNASSRYDLIIALIVAVTVSLVIVVVILKNHRRKRKRRDRGKRTPAILPPATATNKNRAPQRVYRKGQPHGSV